MRAAHLPITALLVWVAGCGAPAVEHTEYLPAHPATGAGPSFALMAEPSGEAILASALPGVIVVGWPDGLVMFSHDRLKGGPPFAMKYADRETVDRVRLKAWNALEPLELRGFGASDARSTAAFVAGSEHSQLVYSTLELSPQSEDGSAAGQAVDLEAFKLGWSEAADAMRSVMDAKTPCSKREPARFQQVVVPPIR